MNEINLIGGFYQAKSLPFSAQDTVNWLPVPAKVEGARSPIKLRGLPGLKSLSETVVSPLQIVGDAPNGVVGTAYSYSYTATGGTPPYSFYFVSGTLPSGLSFSSGTISGTPTTVETDDFRVGVNDSASQNSQKDDSISIVAGVLGWRYISETVTEALGLAFGLNRWVVVGINGIESTGAGDLTLAARTAPAQQYYAVAFGAGTFVASCGTNAVATSTDGVSWTQRAAQTANGYFAIIYNGTRFIRTGLFSQTEYSSDGITWTRQDRPGSITSRRMAFKPSTGIVVSANDDGSIHRTTDSGNSWATTTITGDPATGNPIESIMFLGGKFIGLRGRGAFLDVFQSTDDGATFTVSTLGLGTFGEPRTALSGFVSVDSYIVAGGTATGGLDLSDFNLMRTTTPAVSWTDMGSVGVVPALSNAFTRYVFGAAGTTNDAMILRRNNGSCAFLVRDSGSA